MLVLYKLNAVSKWLEWMQQTELGHQLHLTEFNCNYFNGSLLHSVDELWLQPFVFAPHEYPTHFKRLLANLLYCFVMVSTSHNASRFHFHVVTLGLSCLLGNWVTHGSLIFAVKAHQRERSTHRVTW